MFTIYMNMSREGKDKGIVARAFRLADIYSRITRNHGMVDRAFRSRTILLEAKESLEKERKRIGQERKRIEQERKYYGVVAKAFRSREIDIRLNRKSKRPMKIATSKPDEVKRPLRVPRLAQSKPPAARPSRPVRESRSRSRSAVRNMHT